MIKLTRFNGTPVLINADMIQMIERTPDTLIVLINGEKILVREPATVVRTRFIEYQRMVHNPQLAIEAGE